MTAAELVDSRNEIPFAPFRIIMTDGGVYDVRHPEMLLVGLDASVLGVAVRLGDHVFANRFIKLSNDQISTVLPLSLTEQVK